MNCIIIKLHLFVIRIHFLFEGGRKMNAPSQDSFNRERESLKRGRNLSESNLPTQKKSRLIDRGIENTEIDQEKQGKYYEGFIFSITKLLGR